MHSQQVHAIVNGKLASRFLPSPDADVMPGLPWGRHDELFTAAYWAAQAWMWEAELPEHYRLGATLEEELLACLLGGYGIPAEVGLAAYDRLREVQRREPEQLCDESIVEALLSKPLRVGGRDIRYRFPRQKARYVASAMQRLPGISTAVGDRELRDSLRQLPGVGFKTASWAIRNWRRSDQVAILDVHVLRAGGILGIFPPSASPERNYLALERAFLEFAHAVDTSAAYLDSAIWMTMRRLPRRIVDAAPINASVTHASRSDRNFRRDTVLSA